MKGNRKRNMKRKGNKRVRKRQVEGKKKREGGSGEFLFDFTRYTVG